MLPLPTNCYSPAALIAQCIMESAVAADLIKNNGWYEGHKDGPRCIKIVAYNNMFNDGVTFAAVFDYQPLDKYENSPACSNVVTIWEAAD